jgi:hypothetical protein
MDRWMKSGLASARRRGGHVVSDLARYMRHERALTLRRRARWSRMSQSHRGLKWFEELTNLGKRLTRDRYVID